jgi:hypothetical protein
VGMTLPGSIMTLRSYERSKKCSLPSIVTNCIDQVSSLRINPTNTCPSFVNEITEF